VNVASIVDGLLKAGTIKASHSSNAARLPNINTLTTTIASIPVSGDLCSMHATLVQVFDGCRFYKFHKFSVFTILFLSVSGLILLMIIQAQK